MIFLSKNLKSNLNFNNFYKKSLRRPPSSGFFSGEYFGRPRPVRGRGRGLTLTLTHGSLNRAEPDIQSRPSKSSSSQSSATGLGKYLTSSSSGEGLVPNIALSSYLIKFASDFFNNLLILNLKSRSTPS